MDKQTIDAYELYGADFAHRYRTGERVPMARFKEAFEQKLKVIEIGVGSGSDMARLLDAGYDVTGLEPSSTLRREALEHFPQLASRIHNESLPLSVNFLANLRGAFGGVLCSAVLMHIAPDKHQRALLDMAELLEPQGRLLLTVSATRDGLDDERRDEFGRFYAELPNDYLQSLFASTPFRVIHIWHNEDQWHRHGLQWITYLAEKSADKRLRPI